MCSVDLVQVGTGSGIVSTRYGSVDVTPMLLCAGGLAEILDMASKQPVFHGCHLASIIDDDDDDDKVKCKWCMTISAQRNRGPRSWEREAGSGKNHV